MELKSFAEISKLVKVLYVEDDLNIQTQTKKLLDNFFDKLVVASDGQEGLDKFTEAYNDDSVQNFDIVISDINMPIMNGLEMLKQIRSMSDDVHMMLTTAFAESEYLLEAISLNIVHYLLKPLNMKVLMKNIQDICTVKYQNILISQIEQKNARYAEIIDQIAIVTRTDLKGNILYANDEFCRTSGYSQEELVGSSHNIVRHSDMPKTAFDGMWNTLRAGNTWKGKVKNKAKDGTSYIVNATIFPVFDELRQNVIEYMAVRFLITDEEEEKREFKKKVIQNMQIQKKKEIDGKAKIVELEERIKFSSKNDASMIHDQLVQEKKRSATAKAQVSHYEKEIKDAESKYSKLTQSSNQKIALLIEENKASKSNAHKYKDTVVSIQTEANGLKREIARMQEVIDSQVKTNNDLKDVIEQRESQLAK